MTPDPRERARTWWDKYGSQVMDPFDGTLDYDKIVTSLGDLADSVDAAARREGEYEGAINAWEIVASLSASGTPPEGLVHTAKRNVEGLRAAAIRQRRG